MKRKYNSAERDEHVKEFLSGDISIADYCEQHSLPLHGFRKNVSNYRKEHNLPYTVKNSFVPVTISPSLTLQDCNELVYPNGVSLRLANTINPQQLKEYITLLD